MQQSRMKFDPESVGSEEEEERQEEKKRTVCSSSSEEGHGEREREREREGGGGGGWGAAMDEEISENGARLVRRWKEKRVEIGK
ncbi:hypothetical protein EXN66_Car003616 [Channa argus]|uniref:Uncharacterized protein n=1 Tax=Channa argus TaxID=215402 RepID=A0A6G1PCU6_CHAAH|nr:hypothetical protein EXN66_Car003616 [Channa argus]